MPNQDVHWFVEPIGEPTNNFLQQNLVVRQKAENAIIITDDRGVKHEVWDVDNWQNLMAIQASKSSNGLRFNVYKQEGEEKPKIWFFPKGYQHSKKVAKAGTK
jgi:hypothetical protein